MAYITCDQDGKKTRISVADAVTTIGRSHEATIAFPHDRKVSRMHCQIIYKADGYMIEHLSHTAKTRVNGKLISGLWGPLKSGDKIRVGKENLIFHMSAGSSASLFGKLASLFTK